MSDLKPTCGSLFAGIGGGDLGLERAGWDVVWQVELDPWRRKILERHWPNAIRWDDIKTMPYLTDPGWKVDLIIGGFPCQDLSVAGKRAGLEGERSGLFFDFMRVAAAIRPRWLIIENVPGLLSSHEGQDMGIVLETISECGYGLAWRILDSQHFGVPQRRRRVYIVGHLGAPCPPEILFESEGGGGDTPAGGKAGEGTTEVAVLSIEDIGGKQSGGPEVGRGYREGPMYSLQREHQHGIAQPLRSNRWGGSDSHGDEGNVIAIRLAQQSSNGWGIDEDGILHTLDGTAGDAIAFANRTRADGKQAEIMPGGITPSLTNPGAGGRADAINVCAPPDPDGVLQTPGVPGWLDPDARTPDGRRYAALGDAMTVNVIEWIGRRILKVNRIDV